MTELGLKSAANGVWTLACLFALGATAAPPARTLKLIRTIPHSGYSEGLDFHDGFLWNAFPKSIHKIDPKDGSVVAEYTPASDYSESVTWFDGSLWNVSFSDNGLYRGKLKAKQFEFKKVGKVPEVHAWGITHDGKNLIVTGDFSRQLYFLNPADGKLVRKVAVEISDLEDLAWDGRGIWASSFTQTRGQVFRIDPQTGKISPLFSLPDPEACPVVDGIAYDANRLWITGKQCPAIYLVERPSEKDLKPQNSR